MLKCFGIQEHMPLSYLVICYPMYSDNTSHLRFTIPTRVRVQIDGEIRFSNTVVPRSVIPNERVGILLGRRGAIDRIIYRSVPRANINARGESLPPTVWGDLVMEEYLDLYDEVRRF